MDAELKTYDPIMTLARGLSKQESDRLKLLLQRTMSWEKALHEPWNKNPEAALKVVGYIAEYNLEIGKLMTIAAISQGFDNE